MSRIVDIADIVRGLNAQIVPLCQQLLPHGRKVGNEWEVGSLQGEPGRSLKVHLSGGKAGWWKDFAGSTQGDAIKLIAGVLFNGDNREAVKWARGYLGYDVMDQAAFKLKQKELAARAAAVEKKQEAEDQQTRDQALRIFLSGQSNLIGTPVEYYLRGRAIRFDRLPKPPGSLRYVPALWNREKNQRMPGMVASIVRPGDGGVVAVHRTWLTQRGDSSWVKADLADPKMSYGKFSGGFIPLNRGRSNKPFSEAVKGEILVISEGIEDGLTSVMARPDLRTICAVSLANMLKIPLPEAIVEVVIAGQNDAMGSDADATLQKVVDRFRRDGKRVRVAKPPAGVKDFNDLIRTAPVVKPMGQENVA